MKEDQNNEISEDSSENLGDPAGNLVKKRKFSKKIIIIASVVFLILCGGVGYFLMKKSNIAPITDNTNNAENTAGSDSDGTKKSGGQIPANAVVYYDVPEFLVNLYSVSGQASFLKLSISFEMQNGDVPKLESKMPLLRDVFQVYLRELRSDDLQGAAGIFRLRQELLLRVNKIMYPIKITDVLFREILTQ